MSNNLPRISIEISEELKQQVKVKVVDQKTTITKVIHNLLSQWLSDDKPRT